MMLESKFILLINRISLLIVLLMVNQQVKNLLISMLENVALPTLMQSLPSYSDLVPGYNSPIVIIKRERIGLTYGERDKLTICSSHSFLSQNTLKVYS